MVPGVGFEPTNPYGSRILSPLRKPFRHPGFLKIVWLSGKTSIKKLASLYFSEAVFFSVKAKGCHLKHLPAR